MLKRIVFLILTVFLLITALPGCQRAEKGEKLRVVCSVFPLYDWARTVTEGVEGVEVLLLVKNGSDAHSYQPTAEDLVRIASCDVLLWVGGESEAWIGQALEKHPSEGRISLKMTELAGMTLREISAESEEESHHEGHDHGTGGIDEHLWLSLKNALVTVGALRDALCEQREEAGEQLCANASEYEEKLRALDGELATLSEQCADGFLLFADRFPFVYLTEDYGIAYAAAFHGCSTDAEADFDTVLRMARIADERGVRYLVVTESSDGALAESVRRASSGKNQAVAVMDSMQSVTEADAKAGTTYLSLMEKNYETLKMVLANEFDG